MQSDWKPDRSGKYLTVVYRDVIPGDEVGAIVDHPKCVIMSWSNAVHDVEQLKNTPQRQRVLFPTMLRKMWSGSEVQAWIDENINKEVS